MAPEMKMDLDLIRKQAEEIARSRPMAVAHQHHAQDYRSVVHELHVHQIELEIQNEELRASQNDLEVARNKYADLFNNAPVGYVILDAIGFILETNRTFADMILQDADAMPGKPLSAFLPDTARHIFLSQYKSFFKNPDKNIDLQLEKGEGLSKTLKLFGCREAPDEDDVGVPRDRIRIAVVDVTRQHAAEAALRLMNKDLEDRVAERTALAERRTKQLQALAVELIETEERERRRVAHLLHDDLQQVLASAKMQLQAVSARAPSEAMLVNVNQLLEDAIAKSKSLAYELSPPLLNHAGLVPTLEWLSRQMNEQFGMKVDVSARTTRKLGNSSLTAFLFRAAQELLFNIVKHAGVRRAEVCLGESKDKLVVSIIDRGCGFDMKAVHNAAAPKGFGLLSLMERTRSFGGDFVIESSPGNGCRIEISIPLSVDLKAVETRSDAMFEAPHNLRSGGLSENDGIRILFVDDHEVIRHGMVRLMKDQPGIVVVGEAADGSQALTLARQLRPDVVLMDVSMPVMDGIEATRRIKGELAHVRVIGLSMHDDDQVIRKMLEAGADAFIPKTVSPGQLLEAIYGAENPE